jgi:O-acetylserine/cysteine efflux transporter
MNTDRRCAVAALAVAGLAWGTSVPLSKLALGWLGPGWLTVARFGLAAAVLLPVASRRGLRAALTPRILAAGALGYGGSVILQNAGITRTSVTHAALLIGAAPVLVAIIAALWHRTVARPVAWAGFAVSLTGVGLIAVGRGGGATSGGDALVLASLLLSATFTVAQSRLLRNRDPVAVTAVQFLGAALAALPFATAAEGIPTAPTGPGAVLAAAGLAVGGTLLPFTLFAYGQSRVSAELAGAFLNLEPLVGAVAGAVLFADRVGPAQVTGGAAIITGIALSGLPLLSGNRRRPHAYAPTPAAPRHRLALDSRTHPPAAQTRPAPLPRLATPTNSQGPPAASISVSPPGMPHTRPSAGDPASAPPHHLRPRRQAHRPDQESRPRTHTHRPPARRRNASRDQPPDKHKHRRPAWLGPAGFAVFGRANAACRGPGRAGLPWTCRLGHSSDRATSGQSRWRGHPPRDLPDGYLAQTGPLPPVSAAQ